MNFAGILAGGTGTRMGASIPKQFLEIGGIPAIIRTLRTFYACKCVDKVIAAVHPDWKDYFLGLVDKYDLDKARLLLTEGGATRFGSMENLVACTASYLGSSLSAHDLLLVHDCARVFVPASVIEANFTEVAAFDMVTTSMPTIDTVILSDKTGKLEAAVPDRSLVFLDQGPQTFRITEFQMLAAKATAEQKASYIEAGRMYREFGRRVGIVKGDRLNFKLTTPLDLEYAEFLLKKGIV